MSSDKRLRRGIRRMSNDEGLLGDAEMKEEDGMLGDDGMYI